MLNYLDVLARLHETRQPRTYLEVGACLADSLRLAGEHTVCVGVGPKPLLGLGNASRCRMEVMDSDEFFAGPRPVELFGDAPIDMVLIGRPPVFEHVLRDFLNAEALAGPESLIVLSDCLPPDPARASHESVTVDGAGDLWKLLLCLLERRQDLDLCVVDVPPAGLCLISHLDPGERSLRDAYGALLEQYGSLELDTWHARSADVLQRTASSPESLTWSLRLEVSDLRDALDEARGESVLLRSLLAEQATELTECEARLRGAQAEVAKWHAGWLDQAAKLADVYRSTSWRVSAPVRLAGHHVDRVSQSPRTRRVSEQARRLARVLAPGYMARRARSTAIPESKEGYGEPAHDQRERLAVLTPPAVSDSDPLLLAARARQLVYRPVISILMPVYNMPSQYLRPAVESVLAQAYQEWELCVCDDGSTSAETRATLDDLARQDPRIHVRILSANAGISVATNVALAMAEGEYVAMLDSDDELLPGSLLEVAEVLKDDRAIDVVYTDQDYIEADGRVAEPFFKPDWSLEMFRGVMYVGHLLVVRRRLAEDVHGFDPTFEKVQDFEFMLRLAERTKRVVHIPEVLYHWRKIPGSNALGAGEKQDIEPRQEAAVNAHLERCGVPAVARSNPAHAHRLLIAPKPRVDHPLASVIVRAAGVETQLEACLERIASATSYPKLEIIVAGGSVSGAVARRLEGMGTILEARGLRGSAAGLAGLRRATGHLLVSMAGDLLVETPDWLEHFLLDCELPGVACVSPLILASGGEVSSAGLNLDEEAAVSPAMAGWQPQSDGHAGSLSCVREVSAVPGCCYAVKRGVLDQLGGLNPYFATDYYQGVELSVRAVSSGLRNLCTPRVVVRRGGSSAPYEEDDALDRLLVLDAWDTVIKRGDPFWNPHYRQAASRGGA